MLTDKQAKLNKEILDYCRRARRALMDEIAAIRRDFEETPFWLQREMRKLEEFKRRR